MNTVSKLLLLLFSFSGYSVSLSVNFEDKIHSYHEKKPDDPFAKLKNELESKKIDLIFQNEELTEKKIGLYFLKSKLDNISNSLPSVSTEI